VNSFSQTPSPGTKNGTQKWDYLTIENGTTTCGFLAAYPLGVWCHHASGSKPCLIRFTSGTLRCPRCNPDKPAEWRGFVALWDREYVPRFVIVTGEYYESILEIPIGSLVKVSRGKAKYSPCVIRPDPWRTLPLPPSPNRSAEVDLLPSLMRQWKIPELTLWWVEHRVAGVGDAPAASTPATPKPPRKRPAVPDVPVTEADREEGAEELLKVSNRIRGRLAVRALTDGISTPIPSANGQHPPRG